MSRTLGEEKNRIVMQLHDWQIECLNMWTQNGYRGIVNAVTGSGKTVLALAAVQHLRVVSDRELRVKIVVPQTFLASQWKDELKHRLGAKTWEVGLYCGKRKDVGRKYMIYVINSARYSLARHILNDLNSGFSVLLIADECHHYGSIENNRIFDFYRAIDKCAPYYALGLSATPEIVNFSAISTPIGGEIYCYDLGRALKDRIISRFVLFSINLEFSPDERAEYLELSESLKRCLASLKKAYPELIGAPSGLFFAQLQRLAARDYDHSSTAQAALMLMYKRRTLCHMASARPLGVMSIVRALPTHSRIILFCERIQASEQLHRDLLKQYPGAVGSYHSKMADNARRDILERYKHGALRLLICCKALDEGLDIPSTDAGIIVSSSMSARQRVQRLGRILRHSKEVKRIYYLYIGESSEDSELVHGLGTFEKHIPVVTLRYIGGAFIHTEYEKLRNNVLEYVSERRQNARLLEAMDRNIDRALLRGDFLLSEPACRENLLASHTVEQRNYWTSVLYVIHARLGKL